MTTTIHDIPRTKLTGAIEAPASTLTEEAAELLGYAATSRTVVEARPLAAVLAALGIEVLDARAVRRYQYEAAAAANIARLPESEPQFNDWREDVEWRQAAIAKYTLPIPEFVLNKAIQIKRAAPEVEVIVEALESTPDPFLIVRRRDGYRWEGYYVEVWDERSFERAR